MKKCILSLLIAASLSAMDSQEKFEQFHSMVQENPTQALELIPDMDINYRGRSLNQSWTPLHLACIHNQEEIAKKLIERGAQLNEKDSRGFVPLHYALGYTVLKGGCGCSQNLHYEILSNIAPRNGLIGILMQAGAQPEQNMIVYVKNVLDMYRLWEKKESDQILMQRINDCELALALLEQQKTQ